VSRDDIRQGAEELGVELSAHIENVIEALRSESTVLGLDPDAAEPDPALPGLDRFELPTDPPASAG
jgi:hypothetical protein